MQLSLHDTLPMLIRLKVDEAPSTNAAAAACDHLTMHKHLSSAHKSRLIRLMYGQVRHRRIREPVLRLLLRHR